MKTITTDWELIPYSEAWSRQTEWFDALVHAKQNGESYENRIIFCEHPHVYTLGRSGKENNMLLGEEQLETIGALSIISIVGETSLITVPGSWCAIRFSILKSSDWD